MPEAMACGTPVVALRRGSAPELIEQGRTGFVVDTVDEMVEAVTAAKDIDPAECRAHVESRFSPGMMAAAYVQMYERILEGERVPEPMIREESNGAEPRLVVA
jgi:glycosyltransferase involved in cell wall biosynthesis